MDNLEKLENIRNIRRRKAKQKHNTICVGQHYTQTTTNNVNLQVEYILKTLEKISKSNTSNLYKEVIFF